MTWKRKKTHPPEICFNAKKTCFTSTQAGFDLHPPSLMISCGVISHHLLYENLRHRGEEIRWIPRTFLRKQIVAKTHRIGFHPVPPGPKRPLYIQASNRPIGNGFPASSLIQIRCSYSIAPLGSVHNHLFSPCKKKTSGLQTHKNPPTPIHPDPKIHAELLANMLHKPT